jgi:biotin operon repressor
MPVKKGQVFLTKQQWAAVDFTKRTCLLAYELGVSESAINARRRKLGIKGKSARWDSVDWTKSKSEIAKELQVTREAVNYQWIKRFRKQTPK